MSSSGDRSAPIESAMYSTSSNLGKRKREFGRYIPAYNRHHNSEVWAHTKRQRIGAGKHDYIPTVWHPDDCERVPSSIEKLAANLLAHYEETRTLDGEPEDERFYRNTDFWLVGELSNTLAHSGALYSNREFATEQMKIRLAQLEKEKAPEVPEKTGLLAVLASAFQRLTSLRLPFFG